MLKITIPEMELWDSANEEFITVGKHNLQLEHSLLSISKWEALHCKPFLSTNLTSDETIDYFNCMVITQNTDPNIMKYLPKSVSDKIMKYIESPMSATTFSTNSNNKSGAKDSTTITSELIYYWMIVHNIPFECEKWHINRLLTLIRICNIKNNSGKKMSRSEIYEKNRALNAARRAKLNTRG